MKCLIQYAFYTFVIVGAYTFGYERGQAASVRLEVTVLPSNSPAEIMVEDVPVVVVDSEVNAFREATNQ